MKLRKDLEQHIAVFGESGSGKTVLLSSFYGAAQEAEFKAQNSYEVISDDGLGGRLHQNYLGMKRSAILPDSTRFSATSYTFRVRPQGQTELPRNAPFDTLRLVWHDYPGEWFEGFVSGQEEEQRRIGAFKALLESDVALLLVDGQRLLDNKGQEERYLKSLFTTMRNELARTKDDLLADGKLTEFPRIWIIALSKADLLPDMDVYEFRDLIIEKAAVELESLSKELKSLLESSEALTVGEDYLLLSSAKFSPGSIQVNQRIGLDLLLPVAALFPMERLVAWHRNRLLPAQAFEKLLGDASALALPFLNRISSLKLIAKLPAPVQGILGSAAFAMAQKAATMSLDSLRRINAEAQARNDYLTAMVSGFGMTIEQGINDRILIKGRA